MSGFANQVVGGLSKLLRDAIQSPNFVSGASGWTVNKDGSAEFNDVQIRGGLVLTSTTKGVFVYNGPPAFGNMMLSITTYDGFDAYGNEFAKGLTFQTITEREDYVGGPLFMIQAEPNKHVHSPSMAVTSLDGFTSWVLIGPSNIDGTDSGTPATEHDCNITLAYDGVNNVTNVDLDADVVGLIRGTSGTTKSGLQIGNGIVGRYYYEERSEVGSAVADSTSYFMTWPTRVALLSDYDDGAFDANGVWTCPGNGVYSFWLSMTFTSFAVNKRMRVGNQINGSGVGAEMDMYGDFGRTSFASRRILNKGDTVKFYVAQYTGVTKNISTARLSVQREL